MYSIHRYVIEKCISLSGVLDTSLCDKQIISLSGVLDTSLCDNVFH